MNFAKQFSAMFLCLLLIQPSAIAQDPQSAATITKEVTVIIEAQQVRFTSQKAVEEMRLQVFNQSGELVYDSGAVVQPEINWPFQNSNGETIKSGLYGYTLSIKEAGAAEPKVRRGHFIVDKAQDRDGNTDKLWVTSQNDGGIGTELTVARTENTTIAGASAPRREVDKERGGAKREGDGEAKKGEKAERGEVALAGVGVPGQVAKFISEEEIGNSEITELEGNVGIGTASPVSKLDVRGSLTLDPGTSPVFFTAAGGGEQNRFLQLINSPDYRSASGLKAGGILVSDSYSFANPGKNDLVVKGNASIGTASSLSRLTIEGQDALTIRGYEPFLNLYDANSFFSDTHRIQSAHGDLNFFHGYRLLGGIGMQLPPFTWVPRMVIKDGGNVGIGTIYPNHQLSLGRGPTWTRNGWGGSMELENATAIAWKTNAAGNRFGIGHTNGGFYFFRTASDPGTAGSPAVYDMSISDTGVVSVRVLEITGGADFAENFEVNTAPESGVGAKIEAGMVVSIDPVNPGELALSAQAYDSRVAGIISGAGGVKPGMVMSQEGTLAYGKRPVALSGRVYCWVDATEGAVEPGDLLTTSNTPGHAMKANDPAKAQGAIIGKAMTGLKAGKGLVLVLVTLQ